MLPHKSGRYTLKYINDFNYIEIVKKELKEYIYWHNNRRIKRDEPGTIPSSLSYKLIINCLTLEFIPLFRRPYESMKLIMKL